MQPCAAEKTVKLINYLGIADHLNITGETVRSHILVYVY